MLADNCGGLGVGELRRLRQLEEENHKLRSGGTPLTEAVNEQDLGIRSVGHLVV